MAEKKQMPLEENKYCQEGAKYLAKGDKDLKGNIFSYGIAGFLKSYSLVRKRERITQRSLTKKQLIASSLQNNAKI